MHIFTVLNYKINVRHEVRTYKFHFIDKLSCGRTEKYILSVWFRCCKNYKL
jgi:hypothetical protein